MKNIEKNMTVKLYKFRSLGDCTSAIRTKEILATGKFWCAPLWEQNDSMEGVYSYWKGADTPDIFSEKNNYRICSFSGESALKDPKMWGYYANGFKGLAIEIEVRFPSTGLFKVDYCDAPKLVNDLSHDLVPKIITSKLKYWEAEEEYRFLKKGESGNRRLGKITAVYFGNPYSCVDNYKQLVGSSPALRNYLEIRNELVSSTLGKFPCFYASLKKRDDKWRVTWDPINKQLGVV